LAPADAFADDLLFFVWVFFFVAISGWFSLSA